jgi:hypothetical protein
MLFLQPGIFDNTDHITIKSPKLKIEMHNQFLTYYSIQYASISTAWHFWQKTPSPFRFFLLLLKVIQLILVDQTDEQLLDVLFR